MKIAILSDSHWDINSRWEETLRVHDWFADDVKERGVDLVLHAGDFGPLTPIRQFKPAERLAVSNWLRKITERCPFVACRGNHDVLQDLTIFNQLHTLYPVEILETPQVHIVTLDNEQQIAIAGMPWPVKAELLARLGSVCGCPLQNVRGKCVGCPNENKGLSPDQITEITSGALRSVFMGLGVRLRDLHMPSVLLMHAMVRASRVSTGQPICPGQDFEIGQEDIGLVGADFNALGHVHMSQEWTWNNKPIAYCGSPRRTNHGETEEKSYILLEFSGKPDINGGWACTWSRIPIPCTQMLHFECEWDGARLLYEGQPFVPDLASPKGAEIRLRYSVASDQREVAKQAVAGIETMLRAMGAVDVKPEERVIPVTHARAPEITQVLAIKDQLPVLWKTAGDVPSADRQERLFAKLAIVEQESHAL